MSRNTSIIHWLPVVILGLALLALPVFAGDKDADKAETREVKADPNFERRLDLTEEGLTHAVDLWYDAVVKEDWPLCEKYERLIRNIFNEDIWATEMELAKWQVGKEHGEETSEEQEDFLKSSEKLLAVKHKLSNEFGEADTFADKYRLLGGYINALRKELGMPKLELAYMKHLEQLEN
jgi:hypothetical protein